MGNDDTIKLLKECDAGSKMAVASIDDMLDRVQDSNLKELMRESREHHEKLGNDLHSLLLEFGSDEKEPNVMAKSMSKLKTSMKLSMDECDATIADLMTDGCNMGVKSLNKYLNKYKGADEVSKDTTKRLINLEEKLAVDIREFL